MKRLPDSELEVMQIIWDINEPVDRSDIEKQLYKKHKIAVTTLLTLLSRLAEKGFISIEKNGRRSRYRVLVDKKEYLSEQGSFFFKDLCSGDIGILAKALCNSKLTKEEIEELRKLLEDNGL